MGKKYTGPNLEPEQAQQKNNKGALGGLTMGLGLAWQRRPVALGLARHRGAAGPAHAGAKRDDEEGHGQREAGACAMGLPIDRSLRQSAGVSHRAPLTWAGPIRWPRSFFLINIF